ncbi:hypothetical protein BpHYR1_045731 [Brachionus plicatilis]|uniref:Uncharacterized protein n=1 Tax=Brachionus plicatilis TaxID=10195 RepID=A0A3M7PWT6_BRAPC|nr:hypothetical protein BpHYR1_045731 [Brachionus plicatilis]
MVVKLVEEMVLNQYISNIKLHCHALPQFLNNSLYMPVVNSKSKQLFIQIGAIFTSVGLGHLSGQQKKRAVKYTLFFRNFKEV